MYCPKCGKQLPDDAAYCDACGAYFADADAATQITAADIVIPAGIRHSFPRTGAVPSVPADPLRYVELPLLYGLCVRFWLADADKAGHEIVLGKTEHLSRVLRFLSERYTQAASVSLRRRGEQQVLNAAPDGGKAVEMR